MKQLRKSQYWAKETRTCIIPDNIIAMVLISETPLTKVKKTDIRYIYQQKYKNSIMIQYHFGELTIEFNSLIKCKISLKYALIASQS